MSVDKLRITQPLALSELLHLSVCNEPGSRFHSVT